jgi:soluble lytic murein transglycosylase-like protein
MSRGLDIQKAEAALKRAAHKAIHGTREERSGRVISSVIASVGYDAVSANLDVRFVSGRTYRYSGVPPAIYEALMNAESKGAFFNSRIRDRFPFREL